jgi:hypothetical protein
VRDERKFDWKKNSDLRSLKKDAETQRKLARNCYELFNSEMNRCKGIKLIDEQNECKRSVHDELSICTIRALNGK